MKQSNIEKFDPTDLHKFLMQSARKNYEENHSDFNAGMAMMMGLVKKYFCNDFDIAIRDNNGWISVDDELPQLFHEVLTLSTHNTYQILALQEDYFFDFARNESVGISFIKYWQPLPKPPKE